MARRGIGRDAGDEAVGLDAAQRLRASAHVGRHIAAGVDDRVERLAGERGEIAGAVADDRLHALGPGALRPAAVEDGELVAAFERTAQEGGAEEDAAAEDEDVHGRRS
jgi:hypothetical protein